MGCVVAEPVETAFEAVPAAEAAAAGLVARKAVMGVHQVWVHRSARRGGIASRLLDAARARFIFGYAVAKSEVAFSPPTSEGQALTRGYLGGLPLLVY
ncbi:unnamed protein product [Phaeothamnion confervicola]